MLIVKSSPLKAVASADRLTEWFQKQRKSGKPIYYILPSNKYLQEARKCKVGMAFKTFDDLADLVLQKAKVDYFPVSESERALFFQELLARNPQRFFQQSAELRHKAKAYADTYGQLKRLGLTINDLPPQFKEMELVFQEYETEWVQKQRLLDPENRIHQAVAIKQQLDLNLEGIVIDGYLDFSTVQYMMIAYFVALGVEITVYLPAIEAAEIISETKAELRNLGFKIEPEPQYLKEIEPQIEVFSATTSKEEIYGVLQEIVKNHQQVPLSEVGILLADENTYHSKLTKIAFEKQIPITQPQKSDVKRSLLFQLMFQSLLKHNGRFLSRWDYLDIVDTLLRLHFLTSNDYIKQKKRFIDTGFLDSNLKESLEKMLEFRKSLPKKASLITYLKAVIEFLETSQLTLKWKEKLFIETNTAKLKQIRFEWKAYDYIMNFLAQKIAMLEMQELHGLQVSDHIFADWLNEGMQKATIYVERAPKQGVQLFTFRDVALFKGSHLYVIGMNEGTYPKGHKLSGYFQETDLKHLPIPFASPTRKLFRQKEDAFFSQLFSLADKLTFSYVVGLDPHHPLLPSPYLERWKSQIEGRKYSAVNRFTENESDSKRDYEEKVAYHVGIGKRVTSFPQKLENIANKLAAHERGTEEVSESWAEKLRRDKMSVTMLESYAMCPFKYALERILNIQEPLEKRTTLDFRDTGSMLHTIIEKFYHQLNLIGKPFGMFSDDMNETAETVLIDIFEKEWTAIEAKHQDFSMLKLAIEKVEWEKKLRKWWLAEKKHFWKNKHLQSMQLFRLEEAIELELPLDTDTTITLSGKIDRIDLDEDGFVIYDYKSGFASLHFEREVRPGLKLQLPLYLVAMETRLANGHYQLALATTFTEVPHNLTAHGAAYISLRDPQKRAGNSVWREEHFGKNSPFSIHASATKEETLEAETFLAKYELKQRIKALWEGSRQDFSVKPLKCINSCLYKPVCRVTQDQIEAGEGEWK